MGMWVRERTVCGTALLSLLCSTPLSLYFRLHQYHTIFSCVRQEGEGKEKEQRSASGEEEEDRYIL